MKKRINVHDLRKGMYVSALDRPWTTTPFLFQGFEIDSEEQIERLKQLCQHVFIDLARERVPGTSKTGGGARPDIVQPPSVDHMGLLRRSARLRGISYRKDITRVEQEIGEARVLNAHGRDLVKTIMDDVRLGHSLDSAGARTVVAGMVQSVVRNPDALVWFTHLKKSDEYTAVHSLRVCILALTFGRHLGLTPAELNVLGMGALLHDIGKLKVPMEVLNKPGRLTVPEYEIMKSHVSHGVKILEATSNVPAAAIDVARNHHERYSGVGYINGVQGDRIGLFGLIGAIVDAYDAITSDRVYKKGVAPYEALKELYEGRGSDFHGGLVEQFIQCMGVYPIGSVVEMNDGAIGVVVTVNRERRLRPRIAIILDANKRPYPRATVVDLFETEANDKPPYREVRRVLPSGACGIDPTAYLPESA
ncbi:MAG: HD-GYP domain-containing protein [Acidiferrobacteraceae bacterium]